MAGENFVFPWARTYDADQLAAFVEDLWGAASGDNDLATLDAIEKVIAEHAPDTAPLAPQAVPCPLHEDHLAALIDAANGEAPKEVARRLGLAVTTVYTRRQRACKRLGARTVDQAVAMCVLYGWISREALSLPEPPRRLNPQGWKRLYRECAAALREQPDQPRSISPYASSQSAKQAALRIRKALIDDFKPAGAFDAWAHCEDGTWAVRISYLGNTHNTAPGDTR